jgi:hypothetical protein
VAMKILKYFLYVIVALFFLIQFVPSDLPENNDDISNDIILTEQAPENVKLILSKACYDCHSNQTKYPWYSYVAPVSWLIAKDTRLGREELNFSEWKELSKRKKIKVLNEMEEEIKEKKMPLDIYTVIHKDAILSDEEIETITDWTTSLSNKILGRE